MRIWKFGDNVDTDQIIPADYLTTGDPKKLAAHAFAKVRPDFARNVRAGDVIIAGNNFGCGSSREHAPRALIGAGIQGVIAKSFARIFFRNAINIGLPVIEADILAKVADDDELEIQLGEGVILNRTTGDVYHFHPLPAFMQQLLKSGGLIKYIQQRT